MFDVSHLIQAGGILLITAIIFAESGMMIGFFFPGDTLLFSAGIFAAQGKLSIGVALVAIAAAAIIGDNVGYQIGRSLGPKLFKKPDSLIFRKEYIDQAEAFYEKHGSKAMLIAHFVPIIRAFAPVTAGAGNMNRSKFILYDAIGDIAWTLLLTLLGYFVGSKIPHVERYIEPAILAVIILALAPTIYHIVRDPKIRAAIRRRLKRSK